MLARGFETALAEVLECRHVALQGNVGNLESLGCRRGYHLAQREVLRQELVVVDNLFHKLFGVYVDSM